MATRWFIYIFGLSFSISLYILYTQYEAFLLLALLLLIPIISLCLLFIGQGAMTIKLLQRQFIVMRGKTVEIPVLLKNHLHLPLVDFTLSMGAKDTSGNFYANQELSIDSFVLHVGKRYCAYQAMRCGRTELQFGNSVFYDLLKMFTYKKKINLTAAVFIMPKFYKDFTAVGRQAAQMVQPAGELLGIRPYRYGDIGRSIHWKVSIAHDDIYAKEFYVENETGHTLLLDIPAAAKTQTCNGIYDTFYAVGAYLIGRYGCFNFAYLLRTGLWVEVPVTSMQAFDQQLIEYMRADRIEDTLVNLRGLADTRKTYENSIFYVSTANMQDIVKTIGGQLASQLTAFTVGSDSASAIGEADVFINENDVAGSLAAGVWQL